VSAEGAHLAVFLDIGRGGTLVKSNCSPDELGIASESSCFSPLEDEIPDVLGRSSYDKTTSETTFDENFRVETPPTQMSLLKSNKKLASDIIVNIFKHNSLKYFLRVAD
jgi:hypothetical protein